MLCLVLALFIFLQQGKGDLGMNSLGTSGQMLFGGSGGQNFFERATWIMGLMFVFGSLGLTIMQSKYKNQSQLAGYSQPKKNSQAAIPAELENQATQQDELSQQAEQPEELLDLEGDDE